MTSCCLQGAQWQAEPQGCETKVNNRDCYVTGSNPDVAILIIHDLFGWTFVNTRMLADQYAAEVGATVYIPDFFGGLIIPPSILTDPSGWAKLDLTTFHQQNSKPIRSPEITSFAQFLRTQHRRVGAIGFCYGGWAVFHLGAKPANPNSRPLVDCVSAVHPTWLTKEEMSSVGAPVQIVAPEKDHEFTEELKTYAVTEIAKLGVPFDYQYFPRMEHGFATRGDREDKEERRAVGRARRAAVAWLREWLVEGDQEKVEGCGETGEGAASLYP